jgi:hypothetical protein
VLSCDGVVACYSDEVVGDRDGYPVLYVLTDAYWLLLLGELPTDREARWLLDLGPTKLVVAGTVASADADPEGRIRHLAIRGVSVFGSTHLTVKTAPAA